jgi:glycerol-3-phosphate dehydrogenase
MPCSRANRISAASWWTASCAATAASRRRSCADAKYLEGLGRNFGANLTQFELEYLVAEEWAQTAEDVLWRRTKCGLHMTQPQRDAVADFMKNPR